MNLNVIFFPLIADPATGNDTHLSFRPSLCDIFTDGEKPHISAVMSSLCLIAKQCIIQGIMTSPEDRR